MMDAGFLLDLVLAVLVLGVATWTTITRAHFPALVGYIVYGLLLALVWVQLAAVDVALTEAAIGSGVTGAVLIAAIAKLRATEMGIARERPSALVRHGAKVLCVLVAFGLSAVVLVAPEPPPSLAQEASEHLKAFGIGNPLTAVLIVYRAIDTMLEKVVLLLALLGVWSLAPDRFWGGAAEAYPEVGAEGGVLAFLARVLPPIGIVVGVYVLWVGAVDPGGAFQGGAILAAMWILVMMARLRRMPETGVRWLRLSVAIGPAVFLAVALAGFVVADGFLSYPEGIEKKLIIAVEVVLTFSIAVILGLLAAGPANRSARR